MKLKILIIGLVLLFAACAAASVPAAAKCWTHAQAGMENVTIEGGHEIVTVRYAKPFCTEPVVVVTGDEATDQVKIGVTTPDSFSLVITGDDVPVRVYWQAMVNTQENAEK